MSDGNQRKKIARLIREHDSFLICGHIRPDLDCIGSQLALYHALREFGKKAEVWLSEKPPDNCAFLPGSSCIHYGPAPKAEHRAVFALDTPKPERLGRIAEFVTRIPVLINIDHHPSNVLWGRYNWVDAGASATAEFIYLLIKELGVPIERRIAACLYAGILTDTGRFCYCNTTPFAHEIASDLIRAGVSPEEVAGRVYGNNRVQKMRLLSRALGGLRLDESGELAWLRITGNMYGETGSSSADAEGFVNYARDIAGVRVAALFEEMDDGKHVRVSLRSRDGKIDVNRIAQGYGGGGHGAAAGAVIEGGLEDVERKLLGAIKKSIGDAPAVTRLPAGQ